MTQSQTRRSTLCTLSLLALSQAATADHLYVDDDGAECPSAQYSTIQDAVDAAADGDMIWVYPGTYTGTGDEVVFIEMKELEIWGYEINGERPVVDGEGERRCFTIIGQDYTQISANNELISLHKLDLVRGSTDGDGGGILAQGYVNLSSLRISDCSADGSGGGLAFELPSISHRKYTNANLYSVDIDACHADRSGGGISCSNSRLMVNMGSVTRCLADREGGGIFFESMFGDVTLWLNGSGTSDPVSISDNEAKEGGGGIAVAGGVYVHMHGVTLSSNRTWGDGGGMLARDSSVYWGSPSESGIELTRNVAALQQDQSGGNGGGVYLLRSDLISQSDSWHLFEENFAEGSGGALYAKDSEVALAGLVVEENVALNGKCGGFFASSCPTFDLTDAYFWSNEGPHGAALYLRGCTAHLDSLNVRYNQANAFGAAILVKGGSSYTKLSNSDFLGNAPRHVRLMGGTADDGGGNSFH